MAESTLTLGYSNFQATVGRLLGYGTTISSWSTDQVNEVDEIIQSGLRQFYFPPYDQFSGSPYKWSFLYLPATLTTVTDYSTGTISSSGTTVTLSGGTLPTWIVTNGLLVVNGTDYTIVSRTDNTHFELSSTPSVAFSSDTYTIEHDGNYLLPDDFGSIEGTLTYPKGYGYPQIKKVSENTIRQLRSYDEYSSTTYYYAIRTKSAPTATASTRQELMLYPRPTSELVLSYSYMVLMNKLSTSYPEPYGGMIHSETILESILSIMEERGDNVQSIHKGKFAERLIASIGKDQENAPDFLGLNTDSSDNVYEEYRNVDVTTIF
jgi:hypothetical protein